MVIYGNYHELEFFFTDDKLLLHIYVFIDSKSFGFNWYELTYVLELNINLETHMSSMQVIWSIYNNRNKYRINPWFCWKAYHSTDIQLSIYIPFTFFFFVFHDRRKAFPFNNIVFVVYTMLKFWYNTRFTCRNLGKKSWLKSFFLRTKEKQHQICFHDFVQNNLEAK